MVMALAARLDWEERERGVVGWEGGGGGERERGKKNAELAVNALGAGASSRLLTKLIYVNRLNKPKPLAKLTNL